MEKAMTDWTCQKWFVKFHAEDFSLDNVLWLGSEAEVYSDQIKTFRTINVTVSTWEIADILKISKSINKVIDENEKRVLFYGN